jgi:hypothetical protein
MRLAAFILSLLLLAGTVEATTGWLAAVAVFTGLAAFRLHLFWPFAPRPAFDVRMAAFVLALLLVAGAVDPTRGWLIGLTIATGVAMVCPGIISIDGDRGRRRWQRRRWDRWAAWDAESFR